MACAFGALDALSENSTLNGRDTGLGFGGGGAGVDVSDGLVEAVELDEGVGVDVDWVRGQKKYATTATISNTTTTVVIISGSGDFSLVRWWRRRRRLKFGMKINPQTFGGGFGLGFLKIGEQRVVITVTEEDALVEHLVDYLLGFSA